MRKRQTWGIGDVFLVRLKDEAFAVGQIVGQEREVLNSVSCAFFDWRVEGVSELSAMSQVPLEKRIAVLFVTRDLLDNGAWRIVAKRAVSLPKSELPYERLRAEGFVGATIRGSGIVEDFLNAFFGLSYWDDWHDPAYLDDFLVSPDKKPVNLIFKHKNGA